MNNTEQCLGDMWDYQYMCHRNPRKRGLREKEAEKDKRIKK